MTLLARFAARSRQSADQRHDPACQQMNRQVTMRDSNGHVILNFDLFNE